MQIYRMAYPISTLGPGERLVIWTIGCTKKCFKCANPELWDADSGKDVDVNEFASNLKKVVKGRLIDGITVTGGDPLEQITELNILLKQLRTLTDDILIYTGFTLEEAQRAIPKNEYDKLKELATVLVTGRYVDEQNDNVCPLRGSSNQQVIFFDNSKEHIYQEYMKRRRIVQNWFTDNRVLSIGIHNKEY